MAVAIMVMYRILTSTIAIPMVTPAIITRFSVNSK